MGWKILCPGSEKGISVILIVIIILNLVLFAIGAINQLLFWAIIVIMAIMAYKVVPRLK